MDAALASRQALDEHAIGRGLEVGDVADQEDADVLDLREDREGAHHALDLQALVARIKVLSNLKLDEKRLPQDGRFKIETADQKVSFRVSILPIFYGEKIVMRILDQSQGFLLIPAQHRQEPQRFAAEFEQRIT